MPAGLGASQSNNIDFNYEVFDGDVYGDDEYDVSLTVNPPANAAPAVSAVSRSITGATQGATAPLINMSSGIVTDNDVFGDLILNWTDSSGNNPVLFTANSGVRIGSHGTISYASGDITIHIYRSNFKS